MVECRTPEREVRGSRPTAAVLCPWARHFTPRKYWLITQEAMAPSQHDWKIVDWDVKPQHNQPFPILWVSGVLFHFSFYCEEIFLLANSENPDQTPRSAASDLGLHCLPMSQKWDARLIWVLNSKIIYNFSWSCTKVSNYSEFVFITTALSNYKVTTPSL